MKKFLYIFVFIVVALAVRGYYWGFEPCEDQLAYDYSPSCVSLYQRNAESGDAAAAYNLALYLQGHDNAKMNHWVRIAAQRGDMRAVSQALSECGEKKLFSSAEVEGFLKNVMRKEPKYAAFEAMYFYLGGSCANLDLKQVRSIYENRGEDEKINLCSVALKYGEVVIRREKSLEPVDWNNATELLTQCKNTVDPDSESYREVVGLLAKLSAKTQK